MKKLYWFGLGVLLVALLALVSCEARAGADDLTAQEVGVIIRGTNESESLLAVAWVVGLAQGAYSSYIIELTRGGLDGKSANAIAMRACGGITPLEVFSIVERSEKLNKYPLRQSLPYYLSTVCHEGSKT